MGKRSLPSFKVFTSSLSFSLTLPLYHSTTLPLYHSTTLPLYHSLYLLCPSFRFPLPHHRTTLSLFPSSIFPFPPKLFSEFLQIFLPRVLHCLLFLFHLSYPLFQFLSFLSLLSLHLLHHLLHLLTYPPFHSLPFSSKFSFPKANYLAWKNVVLKVFTSFSLFFYFSSPSCAV